MELNQIITLSGSPAVRFAAAELRRYLEKAQGARTNVSAGRQYEPGKPAVWLGLFADFPAHLVGGKRDSCGTDEYVIDLEQEGGVIAASNPRSVLFGVYRYLTALGFCWVRPGTDGEIIPDLSSTLPHVRICDKASYRHRGVCIEGAVSEKHVRDMVDWLPKLGFNGYFIQFREAYNFFQRWYEHVGNPYLKKQAFSLAKAREMTRRLRAEIKKRGLELHMVGHGWTCEPFGIPGTGWYQHEGVIPPEAMPFLAELNGERDLFGGVALNTNLCYGNPQTRQIITDAIAEYARENPDVDIIHFWLADGSNNHCECPLCREHRPADLYVQMLNELDEKLTAEESSTRIVFLIYVDLLWPPLKERIRNPERFILMFAPITRSHSQPFPARSAEAPKLPPFRRNKLTFPRDPQLNLAFLLRWQEMFAGESFDFNYHFMWDHYKDPGCYSLAKVLHQDLQRLREVGLDGFVSCQVQRAFFPTGLGMTVLGRMLWDRNQSFGTIAEDYFRCAFGENGEVARRYCETLSKLFSPPLLRGEANDLARKAAPRKLAEVRDAVDQVLPAIERGTAAANRCHAASWKYLGAHTQLVLFFADALAAQCRGQTVEASAIARRMFDWARHNERKLHPVFDILLFQLTIGPLLGIANPANE